METEINSLTGIVMNTAKTGTETVKQNKGLLYRVSYFFIHRTVNSIFIMYFHIKK